MSQPPTPVNATPTCQVCGKQALFQCSQCNITFYCSRDHQFQHWKQSHKNNCKTNKAPVDDLQKKILQVRKSYYQNFSHKQFSQCLLDAKVLVGLQRKQLLTNQASTNELDYGATVCLLAKTYLLLNDKKSAKQEIQNYLKEKKALIQDLNDVPAKQKDANKQKFYEYLQKKLNLISCIGNLCYAIGMESINYYALYTRIIINFFGQDSYQASNCYFLIGCYYAEQGHFKKAIECFKKSANIRGQFGGDCLFNIGILYKLQGELQKALQILQKALKLRQQQYGEDSSKVAQINELMGIVYTELNDFKTAMIQYDKAFRLRSTQPYSPQHYNVLDLIHQLYDKLTLFIEAGQPKVKKSDIYTHLKMSIENQKSYWQLPKYKKKINDNMEEREAGRNKQEVVASKQDQAEKQKQIRLFQHTLVLTEEFNSTLGLADLFRLSQLQLQLQKCTTQFGVIYTIGTSSFYENLSPQKYKELQKNNLKLFQLIKLQQLNKIKNSQV